VINFASAAGAITGQFWRGNYMICSSENHRNALFIESFTLSDLDQRLRRRPIDQCQI